MIRQALVLSALLMAASPAFAGETCPNCSKKCMTQCAKGHSKNCKCKMCDCAKTGKCEGGSCHKGDEAAAKTPSAHE